MPVPNDHHPGASSGAGSARHIEIGAPRKAKGHR
jgi:hypothetical protein